VPLAPCQPLTPPPRSSRSPWPMTRTRATSPTLPAPSRRHPTGLASSPLSPPASPPHLLRSTSPRTRPSPSAPSSPAPARACTGSASSSPRRAASPPPAPRGLRRPRPRPCECPCSGCAPTGRPQRPPLGRRLPPAGSASAHAPAGSASAFQQQGRGESTAACTEGGENCKSLGAHHHGFLVVRVPPSRSLLEL
uniref:Uncharacterized protein n=4 Tax=Aegilops tauschii subsp. strangulata TaxID=200361 RepID=A0A453DVA8_AEGTS